MELTAPPAPGIYPDATFEEYLSWDCASRSTLSRMANWREYTPQDVRHEMLTSTPDKESQALGTALHWQVSEPEAYEDHVALGPVNDKTHKTYGRDTKKWADYEAEHHGKTLLGSDQVQKVPFMVAAIEICKRAAATIRASDQRELTIVANLDLREMHERLGFMWPQEDEQDRYLLTKTRLDLYCPELKLVADLKTTKEKTEYQLQRAFAKFGYSHQAALYPEVARAAGLEAEQFAAIFVRNEAPFRAGVFRADQASVEAAQRELLPAMVTMAECYRTEEWPGWSDEVQDITLPDWKLREMER